MSFADTLAVDKPSELINPTIESGVNTRTLISICDKLLNANEQVVVESTRAVAQVALEREAMAIKYTDKETEQNPELTNKLYAIFGQQKTSKELYTLYLRQAEKSAEVTNVFAKLLRGLSKQQEEKGANLKTDLDFLRYITVTYGLIDGRWADFRQAQYSMLSIARQISALDAFTGQVEALVRDSDTGKEQKQLISLTDIKRYREELGML